MTATQVNPLLCRVGLSAFFLTCVSGIKASEEGGGGGNTRRERERGGAGGAGGGLTANRFA